jgi:hypothetical protein
MSVPVTEHNSSYAFGRLLLDEHEAEAPDVDGDRLARAGWTLQLANKWIAPATVITWLKERPNHSRLAIAGAVLLVSWNPTPEEPPASGGRSRATGGTPDGVCAGPVAGRLINAALRSTRRR